MQENTPKPDIDAPSGKHKYWRNIHNPKPPESNCAVADVHNITYARTIIRRVALGENIRVIAVDLNLKPSKVVAVLRIYWDEYLEFLNRLDNTAIEVYACTHLINAMPQFGNSALNKKHINHILRQKTPPEKK